VIGAIARPKFLMFVPDLPKTRSGKIMRRLRATSRKAARWAT
jgi:acyl-coenzyme A synthetase/AMP-(fatty) acid ligase